MSAELNYYQTKPSQKDQGPEAPVKDTLGTFEIGAIALTLVCGAAILGYRLRRRGKSSEPQQDLSQFYSTYHDKQFSETDLSNSLPSNPPSTEIEAHNIDSCPKGTAWLVDAQEKLNDAARRYGHEEF
jgi:hypothetical protein